MWKSKGKRLLIVPTDPIDVYDKAGVGSWLEAYFNPHKMFEEVFAISPFGSGKREGYGMKWFLGVKERDFSQLLHKLRPDVVRAYGGFWPADLVTQHRAEGVPVIVSVHDSRPELVHDSVKHADFVFCVSSIVAREVLARGTQPSQIRILPNRVNVDIFRPRNETTAFESISCRFPPGKHILHIGRKADQKNLDTLIRALARLPQEYSCTFIGMGDCSRYLSLAEEIGVEKRCFWVEAVNNFELPLWYSWFDCFCVPSRWEGFGIVFAEAAACGAGIVTSDIAPMNEFLTNDINACLVKDYENPVAIAQAIHRVCEDHQFRQKIRTGAPKVAELFDARIIDTLEAAFYMEAIRSGPHRFSLLERIKRKVMASQRLQTIRGS